MEGRHSESERALLEVLGAHCLLERVEVLGLQNDFVAGVKKPR